MIGTERIDVEKIREFYETFQHEKGEDSIDSLQSMLQKLGSEIKLDFPLATHEVFSIMDTLGYAIGNQELNYLYSKKYLKKPELNKYHQLIWNLSNLKELQAACEIVQYYKPMPNPLHDHKKKPIVLSRESTQLLMSLPPDKQLEVIRNLNPFLLKFLYESIATRDFEEKAFMKKCLEKKMEMLVNSNSLPF